MELGAGETRHQPVPLERARSSAGGCVCPGDEAEPAACISAFSQKWAVMGTQGSVTRLKSAWLGVPLHQAKRIREFTAHLAKSTPHLLSRSLVGSHAGKKPVSFGHH